MTEPPDPFECARRFEGISVDLKPEDVMDVLPQMTHAEACQLLREHSARIALHMLAIGIREAYLIHHEKGKTHHAE